MGSRTQRRGSWTLLVAAGFLLWPTPALADTGIPMLALVWPASWGLLVPIVLAEALVAVRVLGLSFGRSLKLAGVANLVSTLVGIPLTWFGVALVFGSLSSRVDMQAANGGLGADLYYLLLMPCWINPRPESWMVVAATIILCVPFFFVSVWVEAAVVRLLAPEVASGQVKRWAWRANGITYGCICILLAGMLVFLLVRPI